MAAREDNIGVGISHVGDSQANGEIERAIETVQGQVRTMKSALAANYNADSGDSHAVAPWMASHASSLISKFALDTGGKTARERSRGKNIDKPLPQFGECIMHLKH